MSLPSPRPGLVICYSFLWSAEARAGATEGRKDRPAVIVVATRKVGDEVRVIVAPITHSPPDDPATSVKIPPDVAASLGLDGQRQWVRLDELNRFSWPGFDLRPVPGRPGVYHFGMLPRGLYERVRGGILALQKARALTPVARD